MTLIPSLIQLYVLNSIIFLPPALFLNGKRLEIMRDGYSFNLEGLVLHRKAIRSYKVVAHVSGQFQLARW